MAGKIHVLNTEGFHVEFGFADNAEYTNLMASLTDPDMGYKPFVPAAGPVASVGGGTSSNSALACRFCGKEVTGTVVNGKTYTAQDIFDSRSKKFDKMGEGPGGCCANCWNKGGHKTRWDKFYAANS